MSTTVTKWFARWWGGLEWCSAECRVTAKQVRILRILSSSGDAAEVERRVRLRTHPATRFVSVVYPGEAFDSLDAALLRVVSLLEKQAEAKEREGREARSHAQEVERARREVTR